VQSVKFKVVNCKVFRNKELAASSLSVGLSASGKSRVVTMPGLVEFDFFVFRSFRIMDLGGALTPDL
jgi:hypothetical protein